MKKKRSILFSENENDKDRWSLVGNENIPYGVVSYQTKLLSSYFNFT